MMTRILSTSFWLFLVACGQEGHEELAGVRGTLAAAPTGSTVYASDKITDRRSAVPGADGRFELVVAANKSYVLSLVDREGREVVLVGRDGAVELAVPLGTVVDVGLVHQDQGGSTVPEDPARECVADVSDCEFTTYNLEVAVGDTFRLGHFVSCEGVVGRDYYFAYEGREDWNLDAFDTNDLITIVEEDADGGNHGDGRYRFSMFSADGEELDHMTIRIDDKSDIRARHADPIVVPDPCEDEIIPGGL